MRCLILMAALAACGDNRIEQGPDLDMPADDDDVPGDDEGPDDASPIDAAVCTAGEPVASEACDPLTQSPCPGTSRCGWVWDSIEDPATEPIEPTVGRLGCVCAGDIGIGDACVRSGPSIEGEAGTGSGVGDGCVRGAQCMDGVCRAFCDRFGGEPGCGSAETCVAVPGLFPRDGMTWAGLCMPLPTCDPLTQRELGSGAEACGSPNPAAPDLGCYFTVENDGDRGFACDAVLADARGRTDGEPAHAPASGGAYLNGCEAGYLPVWRDSTDDTVTVCAGICAPVPTDNTMPDGAAGDPGALAKLHDQPAARVGDGVCVAGKKGHGARGDCRFFDATVGVCFAYSEYTYDHDDDPATDDITAPSCAELPPAGGDPSSTVHGITADEAGCYRPGPSSLRLGRPLTGRVLPHALQ